MDEARLTTVPLFAGLSRRERRRLAQLADEIEVAEGKDLVREGEFAYEVFVIRQGSAEVSRREGGHVADLGPGDFFGEMGAIDDLRRNASVVCTSPMTAIVMTAHEFRVVAREMPTVAERLRAACAERTKSLV